MNQVPDFQRLYRADVSEEFAGGEFCFSHYLLFFPDGTLRCCLKQDFSFPSGQYQDPQYMEHLLASPDINQIYDDEIMTGLYTVCGSSFSFSVFHNDRVWEAGTITIRENILYMHVHTADHPKGTLREYIPC